MASYAEQNTDSRRKHDFNRKPENGVLHNLHATGHSIWKRQEINNGNISATNASVNSNP